MFSQWSRISKQFRVSHILTCSGLALSAVTARLLDKYRASESLLSGSRLLRVLWPGSVLDSRSTPLPLCGQTKWLSHLTEGENPRKALKNILDCGVIGSLIAPMPHFKVRILSEHLWYIMWVEFVHRCTSMWQCKVNFNYREKNDELLLLLICVTDTQICSSLAEIRSFL